MINKKLNIICFGDSNTVGYGLPKESSYPNQLQKLLNNADFQILNEGISGDAVQNCIVRFEKSITKNKHQNAKNICVLQIGTNNFLFGDNVELTWHLLNQLWQKIISEDFELWAVTLPYRNDSELFNAMVKDLNSKIKNSKIPSLVIDFYSLMFSKEGHILDNMLQQDGLHLTHQSCEILAQAIKSKI